MFYPKTRHSRKTTLKLFSFQNLLFISKSVNFRDSTSFHCTLIRSFCIIRVARQRHVCLWTFDILSGFFLKVSSRLHQRQIISTATVWILSGRDRLLFRPRHRHRPVFWNHWRNREFLIIVRRQRILGDVSWLRGACWRLHCVGHLWFVGNVWFVGNLWFVRNLWFVVNFWIWSWFVERMILILSVETWSLRLFESSDQRAACYHRFHRIGIVEGFFG